MKKLLIVPLVLALTACNSIPLQPTVTKYKVVTPDPTMYDCPVYKKWPNADKLTDVEVAKLIVKLYKNNVRCKNTVDGIEKFLNKAKTTVEGPTTPPEQPGWWNPFK
jgi:hypothetical protein